MLEEAKSVCYAKMKLPLDLKEAPCPLTRSWLQWLHIRKVWKGRVW